MNVAVMQPYIFPYIGYFQMISAVDVFVFYDDVNYIKNGWINRNRILVNGNEKLFTVPLKEASSFRLIKDIEINKELPAYKKILPTIEQNYKKAPLFEVVFPIIETLFNGNYSLIGNFAIRSIECINQYLEIPTILLRSSIDFPETKGLERSERLTNICKKLGANTYINAVGGKELYTKEKFALDNIDLQFIKPKPIDYQQFNKEFVPWLSIIDVLMFNSSEEVRRLLIKYETI